MASAGTLWYVEGGLRGGARLSRRVLVVGLRRLRDRRQRARPGRRGRTEPLVRGLARVEHGAEVRVIASRTPSENRLLVKAMAALL